MAPIPIPIPREDPEIGGCGGSLPPDAPADAGAPAFRLEPPPTKASKVDLSDAELSAQELRVRDAVCADESLRPICRTPGRLARDLLAAGPGVNVVLQVGAAGRWLRKNPQRRKRDGYRFLVTWVEREQERAGGGTAEPDAERPPPPRTPPVPRAVAALVADAEPGEAMGAVGAIGRRRS